jgi:hypothetical protein
MHATVSPATMKKLQSAKMRSMVPGTRPAGAKPKAPSASSTKALPGLEKEALLKSIAAALQGKSPEDKGANTEAIKKVLEAVLETDQGKKAKSKLLGYLLSAKGAPLTAVVGSAALAAMVANNTTIPSTPEIPIRDNLSVKFEFEGTLQKPTGIKISFKFIFGGPKKEKRQGKERTVLALPKELHAYIDRIDRRMLFKWFAQRALWEWESAGPDNEHEKLEFYKLARDRPDDLGLPDTRLVAEKVSRVLVETAIQNRIKQLQGKGVAKIVEIDLEHAQHWNQLLIVPGLAERLAWLLKLLVPKVPYGALGLEQVTFKCGKWPIAVPVKR